MSSDKISLRSATGLTKLQSALAKRGARGEKDVLLVDRSGSMMDFDAEGRAKIDGARLTVAELRKQGFSFQQYIFDDTCELSDYIEDPRGGTNLANAIETIYADCGPSLRRISIVSDGMPDSPSDALRAVDNLPAHIIIDCFYIGRAESQGAKFMESIAQRRGGSYGVSTQMRELTSKIAGALCAGTPEAEDIARGPIAL